MSTEPALEDVHVAVDPWSRGSRHAALRAAVHKFDGFDIREEWDVRERIVATVDAAGYEELFQLVLDSAAERQHIHFADDCPRSKQRVKDVRSAKRQADLSAAQLAAERDVLLSIVRDLAARHPGFDTHTSCLFCADAVEDHTDPDCLWVRARAFLASQETPEGEPK